MKAVTRFLLLTTISLTAALAWAQDTGWPRVVKDGGTQIVVYQPEPDSLDGMTVHSRVAISIKRPTDNAPLFGALWISATLKLDRDQDLAHVTSVRIERTRFAEVAENDVSTLIRFLEAEMPRWDLPVSLTQLRASLHPAAGRPDANFRNDPPKIVVLDSPAILLLLDGEPRVQDTGTGGLQQVVNTALPVIFDPRSKQYWFYGSSVWFTTSDLLRGKWTWANNAPSNIADLVKDPETLNSAQSDAGKIASTAQLRTAKIVVATEPTELLVTDGPAKYSPLPGGEILYVTNTDSDIFMEVATQRHYIVISGRWFAGPSLHGPWNFIAPESLPRAFAAIPENSPKADVLAFVPGTDRAKDALLDNVIPQTAEVSRRDVKIDVQYDGAPKFSPIPNTSLAYAENTPSQVIRSNGRYFACVEGVWYVAPSPAGPWSVADARPLGVDDIPPSSPVYNTKYVYIYDSTPDFVYVGYLPGYRWSLPYHGVVFYGTGYHYRGWFGRRYYPRPATWGFYPRYNPWVGWNFGMSWTPGWLGLTSHWGYAWAGWGPPVYGPGFRPGFWSGFYTGGWFGPGGYRPPHPHYWRPPGRPAPGRPAPGRPTILPHPGPGGRGGNSLYGRPGNSGVRPRPGTLPGRSVTGPPPGTPQSRPPVIGRPGVGKPGLGRPGGMVPRNGSPSTPPPGRPNTVTKPDADQPNNAPVEPGVNVPRNGRGNGQTRPNQPRNPATTSPSRPAPTGPAPARPSPSGQPPAGPAPAHPARPVPQAPPSSQGPRARPPAQTEPRGGSIEAESDPRNSGTRGRGGSAGRSSN